MIGIKVKTDNKYAYITMNYRHIVENNWVDDLKYLCDPTEYHEKRITVKFICDIGVSREFNRHRVNSISEQSTRYCDYASAKHGYEINIIHPIWIKDKEYEINQKNSSNYLTHLGDYCEAILYHKDEDLFSDIDYWMFANLAAEYSYLNLRRLGRTPQEARVVLPLGTKSELVHTAFVSDWKHFFKLRDANDAHPDARKLAHALHEEFINRDILKPEKL